MLKEAAVSSQPEGKWPAVGERYRLEGLLGEGGMGEVYRCHDGVANRAVALKRLRPHIVRERPSLAALFEREYHALRELAHPSIIQVFDYGHCEDGSAYYTMELLDGQDLRALAPLPWRQACAVLRDVASSLAILHSRRLLHRDISPGNVHRDPSGRAKLLDFGTMATFGVEGPIVGTPPCIAPEAIHNQPLDARADLYSLGALGYFLLSGQHAYPARRIESLRDLWRSRPRALDSIVADLPQALSALVTSMLGLDALARPASAGEVIERLSAIAGLEGDESLEVARAYLQTPTLVGRTEPLVRLRKQVLRAVRGRGSAVVVQGPPGIGRTRMLDALALEGKLTGATVLSASGRDKGGQPFAVVRELASSLAMQLPDLARAHAKAHYPAFAGALPELGEMLSLPQTEVQPSLDARAADNKAMAALADLFEGVTEERTLVVAVDDIHSADEQSLGIIQALAHRAGRRRLALVVSWVDDAAEERAALSALRRVGPQITLEPLETETVHVLVRSLFGEVPHLAQVADWVGRLAQGRPRNCLELCEHLVERGIAVYREGAWALPVSLHEEELPKSFEDALAERLRQLSPDARMIAQGIAFTTLRLAVDEYEHLLAGGDERRARVFKAVGELVSDGILVGDREDYRLAQPTYADALGAILEESQIQATHRRLAAIFNRRGNTANVPDHLLLAGDELGALQTLVKVYDDVMAGQNGHLPIGRLRAYADDTALAIRTRQHLLELSERLGRSERERFILRRAVIQLANIHDPSLGRAQIGPIVDQLSSILGLQHWDELGPGESDKARIEHCMARAKQHYADAAPQDRVLEPTEALHMSILIVGQGQNIARQAYDAPLLRQLLAFVERVRHLVPRLVGMRNTIKHSLAVVTGHVDAARQLREGLFEYYKRSALPNPDNPMYFLSQIGRGLLLQCEGSYWATLGGARAEQSAALLADPLQGLPAEGNILQWAGHSWLCGALEIRLLMHLFNGDAPQARRTQEQMDQLVMQDPYASDGGFVQLAAQGHALCGDLMGLKQSTRALERIVERQYDGFRPFVHVARGDYQALRGKPAQALTEYQQAVALAAPGEHAAWARAQSSLVEALLMLGRVDEARAGAQEALTACQDAGLGRDPVRSLERVLALAEAASGAVEEGSARLQGLLATAEKEGLAGVPLGQLHETLARVGIYADDAEGFQAAAHRAGQYYRAGGNPALHAKYERLLQAGRTAGFHGASMRPPAGHAQRLSLQATGIRTELAALTDPQERHETALRMMMESAGAASGFLFLWEEGDLRLVAATDDAEPQSDLVVSLTEYVKAELDDYVEVTVTRFDEQLAAGEEAGFSQPGGTFRPVLLSNPTDQGPAIVGVAALFDTGEGFRFPELGVLSTVTSGLQSGTQNVVSLFDVGG